MPNPTVQRTRLALVRSNLSGFPNSCFTLHGCWLFDAGTLTFLFGETPCFWSRQHLSLSSQYSGVQCLGHSALHSRVSAQSSSSRSAMCSLARIVNSVASGTFLHVRASVAAAFSASVIAEPGRFSEPALRSGSQSHGSGQPHSSQLFTFILSAKRRSLSLVVGAPVGRL